MNRSLIIYRTTTSAMVCFVWQIILYTKDMSVDHIILFSNGCCLIQSLLLLLYCCLLLFFERRTLKEQSSIHSGTLCKFHFFNPLISHFYRPHEELNNKQNKKKTSTQNAWWFIETPFSKTFLSFVLLFKNK